MVIVVVSILDLAQSDIFIDSDNVLKHGHPQVSLLLLFALQHNLLVRFFQSHWERWLAGEALGRVFLVNPYHIAQLKHMITFVDVTCLFVLFQNQLLVRQLCWHEDLRCLVNHCSHLSTWGIFSFRVHQGALHWKSIQKWCTSSHGLEFLLHEKFLHGYLDFLAILFELLVEVGVLNNLPFLHGSEWVEERRPVIRAHDGLREGYFWARLWANIFACGYG